MLGRFPQFIDFLRYTDARKTLEGSLSFKFCHRLAAQTENPKGEITFELNFGIDDLSNRVVTGRLETQLVLICQRCMEEFEYSVNVDLALAFVSSSYEEEKIKGMYESYFYEDDSQIDLHALIEDEIILALPLIAKHDESECSIPADFSTELSTDNSNANRQQQSSDAKRNAKVGQAKTVQAKNKQQSFDKAQSAQKQSAQKHKGAADQMESAEKHNPFDILKQLKD